MFFFENEETRLYKRLGYSKDQEGIMKRYLRETEAWAPHLQKTQTTILQKSRNKNKNKAAILGSGWLLDVPIQALSELFGEVWLFDVRHPVQIKHQLSKFPNVKLRETDISGFARTIYEYVRGGKHRPPVETLAPLINFDFSDFDYVVSCNLLNQLDIILLDYLKEQCNITEHQEIHLKREIQKTHLAMLPTSKTCLITDVEEIWIDKHEKITGQKNLIYTSIPEPSIFDSWIWHFDNHYLYHNHCKTWFKVLACDL